MVIGFCLQVGDRRPVLATVHILSNIRRVSKVKLRIEFPILESEPPGIIRIHSPHASSHIRLMERRTVSLPGPGEFSDHWDAADQIIIRIKDQQCRLILVPRSALAWDVNLQRRIEDAKRKAMILQCPVLHGLQERSSHTSNWRVFYSPYVLFFLLQSQIFMLTFAASKKIFRVIHFNRWESPSPHERWGLVPLHQRRSLFSELRRRRSYQC